MLVSISEVVGQFKRDWSEQLSEEAMAQVCREEGMSWRQTLLNPITTLKLFLLQILNGNTAMTNLRHLSKLPVTASAYCQARMKLPLAVCQRLLKGVTQSMRETVAESACWHGHRLFFVDGSSFSMPDTAPLQAHFGQPGGQEPGCGFPVAHFLALTDAATGLILEVLAAPLRTHDMSGMVKIHPQLPPGDLLVADRAFCSFVHLALLAWHGIEAVLRMHQRQIVDFTPNRTHGEHKGWPRSRWLKVLGYQDQLVEWFKPSQCPSWLSPEQFAELPDKLVVRELRYRVECPGFRTQEITLVTTLLDAERYPVPELAEVYFRRWLIETHLRHLKITLGMDVLKCETVDGVLKELAMFVLVYNLVRLVMWEAAQRQQVDIERISFIDALRWLISAQPGEPLIPLVVNPWRPHRYEPRVRKRRPKKYKLMNQPRRILKQQLAA